MNRLRELGVTLGTDPEIKLSMTHECPRCGEHYIQFHACGMGWAPPTDTRVAAVLEQWFLDAHNGRYYGPES